jgi:hypothetical protein
MPKTTAAALFALAVSASSAAPAAVDAQEATSPLDAITGGRLLLNVRARYEHAEQDGKPNDADAFTIRELIGWETKPLYGLSVTLEGINVGHLFGDSYNDTTNGKTSFPTIPDPDNTDINQVYAQYTGVPDTRIRLGKQVIKLDNERFVGNVDFRQVMQVFSGLTVSNRSIPDTELFAGHLWRLKNVFAQQQQIRLEIAHADWTWSPGNHLVGYGYFLDQAKTVSATGFSDNSNQILGARAAGAYPLATDWKLLYTAEFAKQDSYAKGDSRIDAQYNRLGGGGQWKDYFVRLDYERLSSKDGVYGFQTPLATLHPFQGWADQFTTTPAQGIRDWYVSGGVPVANVKLYAEYHRLTSDFRGIDYGKEFDVSAAYRILKGLTGKIEFAYFTEGDPLSPAATRKRDTQRLWLTLVYNFE